MKISIMLLASASVISVTPAMADTADAAKQPGVVATADVRPSDDQAAEIIVTAEHRAVNIQKIPLAVTAIDGDLLRRQNIDSPSQLQNLVPGLKIFEVGVQPSILIRGIGGVVANVLNDPAAAYNVDGVAVARPISINGLFFDLERAEVLKGPQGTLYGGNSTVGAINIISRRPEFTFGGSAGITFGNYGTIKTEGVLNVPVSDTLAFRASFQSNRHDGYLTNGSDDADNVGIRLKALFKPSADVEILATGTYFHSGGVGPGDVPLKSPTGSFLDPSNPWFLGTGPDLDNGALVVPNDGHQNLTSRTLSAQIKVRTSIGTFTVVPSYIKTDYRARAYDGGFLKDYVSSDREAGVEARLSSNDDSTSRLNWTVGGIYQNVHQVTTTIQHVNGTPPGPELYQILPLDLPTVSYGLFAQGTYRVFDPLRVTAGIRYTNDKKDVTGLNITTIGAANGPIISSFPDDGHAKFDNVDYRVGFDFDLADYSLLYGNISSGYKAGGINPGLAPNTYKPEHLTSFQVGLKNTLLDRRLQLNVEAWYWKYRDFQVSQFIPLNTPTGTTFGFGSTNANRAKNYGVELMANFRATRNDHLNVNLQYDIAKYVDFIQALSFPVPSTTNYDGQDQPFAPKFSGNVNYEHIFDLSHDMQLVASVNERYAGPVLATLQAFPGQRRASSSSTDLQLTLRGGGDKWEIGGYVENLGNDAGLLFAGATPAGIWGHPRAPRTYGVRVSGKF